MACPTCATANSPPPLRVLITGASGVLGSAVHAAFKETAAAVLGLAHSRATGELQALDLCDAAAAEQLVQAWRPTWVVHCAAERRPDVAQRDPAGTHKLNAEATAHLGQLAWRYEFRLVYVSTDYVFDGTAPPYAPGVPPHPLQLYGETKRAGEAALERLDLAQALVLRVPVLYGPAPRNADSAINVLLDVVQDQSGRRYTMDHHATRYPTNVLDVAAFLVRLARLARPLPRIVHYSGAEPFTKYEICLLFARILGLPHAHIVPETEPPTGAAATTRPRDCQLDCAETEALGVDDGLRLTGFEEWWTARLTGA